MPLTRDEVDAAFQTLIANGLTFGHCTQAFAASTPDEKAYVDHAQSEGRDGELEIDGSAVVSLSDDGGAYVMGWVWVSDKDIWKGDVDSDGEPCRCNNHYHCEECDVEWESDWSCACDDECPTCGKDIQPNETVDLGLDGKPIKEEVA